ncbi:MAG: arylsulfatase [Planctomycetaceae bacterium]|jgi:arylsulfatase A-like enzyme|nr:arylsulfatase [Planctomycetaceae bacterium]
MKHFNLFLFFVCLSLFFSGLAFENNSSAAERPNVILILADDMGYGDVGLLAPECKIKTPHLDQLGREGVRFTDMHSSSSVCTPTRYGILTGRYNWRSRKKSGVLDGYSKSLIPPSRQTIGTLFKNAGYNTAVIGKWHLGLDWETTNDNPPSEKNIDYSKSFKNGPLALGFDYFWGIAGSADMPPFVFLENDRATEIPTTQKKWVRNGPAAESFEAIDIMPKLTEQSITFIENHADNAKNGKPFFLYLPLSAPHTPILPTPQWQGKSNLNPYGDFVMQVDDTVGKIVQKIDQTGLADNTIIIFTADNGCSPAAGIDKLLEKGHSPNHIFRGTKADIFDGGHRVPFLVRWRGKINADTISDELGCLVDFYATFAAILGVSISENAAEDSFNLLPAWFGSVKQPIRNEIIHHSINGSFAIRQKNWKLCLCRDSGGWSAPRPGSPESKNLPPVQLFDLSKDIDEKHNLAVENPEQVETLKKRLEIIVQNGRSTKGPRQNNDGEVVFER